MHKTIEEFLLAQELLRTESWAIKEKNMACILTANKLSAAQKKKYLEIATLKSEFWLNLQWNWKEKKICL